MTIAKKDMKEMTDIIEGLSSTQLEDLGQLFLRIARYRNKEILRSEVYAECIGMVNNPESTEWFGLEEIDV